MTLGRQLLEEVDTAMREDGVRNRSDFIAALVRQSLAARKLGHRNVEQLALVYGELLDALRKGAAA